MTWMRAACFCVAMVAGCRGDSGSRLSPSGAVAPVETTRSVDGLHLKGIVHASVEGSGNRPGKKQFVGVLFTQDDGTRWVIDYSADSPFRELANRRVRIEGRKYEPADQALAMPHLRVTSMEPIDLDEDPALVDIHGEEELAGKFEQYTWEPGTKLAGETALCFVAIGGTRFFIAHGRPTRPPDHAVTIHAHRVTPSPFVTRPGGPYLWIQRIDTP